LTMKTCTKCRITKPLDDFSSQKTTRDGKKSWCKDCCCQWGKEYRLENDDIRYRGQRKDVKEYQREYRLANKDRWRAENRERLLDEKKIYHHANKDRYRASKRNRERLKMKTDPMFKLHKSFSHRLRESLKSKKAGKHWEDIVGYSIYELKKHLEKQFEPGMTWKNHGKWHIDHIVPVKAHNFSKPEDIDFKKCWALKNLQPMWSGDNLKKNAKLDKPFQPCMAFG